MHLSKYSHVKAVDYQILPYPVEMIWPILTQLEQYGKWWPSFVFFKILQVRAECMGSTYRLRPYGWRAFTNTILEVTPHERISIAYSGSFMTGKAEWRLETEQQGTKVIYDMDGRISDWAVAIVGKILDLKVIHSFSMKTIFAGLERKIAEQLRE